MSLKPIKLESVDAKAARVLMAHGRAPNMLRSFDESERAALAELCDESGTLAEGASAGFRDVLMAYNERLKASDADLEGEVVTVQVSEGQSAVVKAFDQIVVRGASRKVRLESELKPAWTEEDEAKHREATEKKDDE